jgi:hypothetical protein
LDGYSEEPAKLAALERLVGELVAAGEKVIVWSFYTASIDAACRRLAGHGVRRYDGMVSDTAVRREAVRAFQDRYGIKATGIVNNQTLLALGVADAAIQARP